MKIKKRLLTLGLPIFATCMILFTINQLFNRPIRESLNLTSLPASYDSQQRIAGIGIVEPKSENIHVGTHVSGIVQKIHVQLGQHVKTGDPLFTIDERAVKAQLNTAYAKLESAKVDLADARKELQFYELVAGTNAISPEELSRKRFAVKRAHALQKEMETLIEELKTTLDRLTVTAPMEGEVLRINTRVGEYASQAQLAEGLIILGDVSTLHVRVEIDETDAQRLQHHFKAKGALRGDGSKMFPLRFVRIEPLIKAKRSLSGDGNERVDTRVLEVIYFLDKAEENVYPGQQLDVFIDIET